MVLLFVSNHVDHVKSLDVVADMLKVSMSFARDWRRGRAS